MNTLSNGTDRSNTHHSFNAEAYTTAKSSVGWRKHPCDIVIARGNDRVDLLQRMTTNTLSGLAGTTERGMGVQNILLTDKARIIDVFTVLARENDLMLLFSPGMGVQAMEWLEKYTFIDDFTTTDSTAEYASFLVFGVKALQLLEEITGGVVLGDVRTSAWLKAALPDVPEIVIVKQPPLCEFCYTLLVPKAFEGRFIEILSSLEGVAEVNDATFETLRIESAWGKLGLEWTNERNPLEAGLVGLVDFKKGCYIGQEVIARLDTYNKVKMRLSGFVSDTPIPLQARIIDEQSEAGKRIDIGGMTSTTFSPELGKYIALGYIRSAFANPGAFASVVVADESGSETAEMLEIVKLPFVM